MMSNDNKTFYKTVTHLSPDLTIYMDFNEKGLLLSSPQGVPVKSLGEYRKWVQQNSYEHEVIMV